MCTKTRHGTNTNCTRTNLQITMYMSDNNTLEPKKNTKEKAGKVVVRTKHYNSVILRWVLQ